MEKLRPSNRKISSGALFMMLLMFSGISMSADLYVNQKSGDDKLSGLAATASGADGPFRSIAVAVRNASPGDTIHLPSGTHHDAVKFRDKAGAPGQPIVLDGHGATLTGSAPLDPADWEALGDGLFRSTVFLWKDGILLKDKPGEFNNPRINRFFLIWNGKINRMGRCSKGYCPPLPSPADLKSGEWTYVEVEKAFYLRLAAGSNLNQEKIEYPRMLDGVAIGGSCSNLLVRNLTVTHFLNDGFGIKDSARAIVFENIRAIECGDDGMSAHNEAQIEVSDFKAEGNGTGITHVHNSRSVNRRVSLLGNGVNLRIDDAGMHVFQDSIIGGHDGSVVVVGKKGKCLLKLENVWVKEEIWPSVFAPEPPGRKSSVIEIAGTGELEPRQVLVDKILNVSEKIREQLIDNDKIDLGRLPTK